jgi:hypothetical protein
MDLVAASRHSSQLASLRSTIAGKSQRPRSMPALLQLQMRADVA